MRNYGMKFFGICTIAVLFICITVRPAERPVQKKTKFIVYSYEPNKYIPIVKTVADALRLAVPADIDIVLVEHNETTPGKKGFNPSRGFRDIIMMSENVDWVCIAHHDKCRPVAEVTRELKNRIDLYFHSILFFDSDPVERISGAITEKISKSFSNFLLDINFEKVLHRAYNLYSEKSSAWYRKIYPADQYIKDSAALEKADWVVGRPPYLKGVNIKCFTITKDNRLEHFNFSKNTSWRPGFPTYAPSEDLERAADKIGQVIRSIDNNYLINTDLTAVLANESLETTSDVIPNKITPDPMVIINRPTSWNGQDISQVIVSEGKITGANVWNLTINFGPEQALITNQIETEARINADKNQITPYFYPWVEYYRSLNLKFRTPGYQWFNQFEIVANAPHKHEIAHAIKRRPEDQNNLCTAETAYLDTRRPIVQKALRSGEKFPKIAIVASGGGIRAMLATLGFLRGLEQINLLNAITYTCGLSGSTWAIGPWIASGQTVERYITENNIIEKVENFKGIKGALAEIAKNFLTTEDNQIKTVFGQQWTFVDSWGLYISKNLLLRPNMQLSQQVPQVTDGSKPLPIYTAVTSDARTRDWFEFTPFEVGSLGRKIFIPSWSFGRQFISGISQDFPPEQSFGYLLGIFGSAMGARLKDVIGPKITAAEWNITAGIIPNFCFGIDGSTNDNIELVDAGADFNLPYPPISGLHPGRKADIIIFLDASGEFGPEVGGELRKVIAWQQKQQKEQYQDLKWPDDMEEWASTKPPKTRDLRIKAFTGDARTGKPTVIYMPLALDLNEHEGFPFDGTQRELIANFQHTHEALLENYTNNNLMEKYPTTTFNYPAAQSNFLLNLMTLNVRISATEIFDEIKKYIATMPD